MTREYILAWLWRVRKYSDEQEQHWRGNFEGVTACGLPVPWRGSKASLNTGAIPAVEQ